MISPLFIVLTNYTEKRVRVNVAAITAYLPYGKGSEVQLMGEASHTVRETPEQIDTMLREQFGTVFERKDQ